MKWYSVVRSSVLRHATYMLQSCSQAAMSSTSPFQFLTAPRAHITVMEKNSRNCPAVSGRSSPRTVMGGSHKVSAEQKPGHKGARTHKLKTQESGRWLSQRWGGGAGKGTWGLGPGNILILPWVLGSVYWIYFTLCAFHSVCLWYTPFCCFQWN